MKLIDYFDKGVARDPSRVFLVDSEQVITYQEAQAASVRLAEGLARIGVGPGIRVATLSGNSAMVCQAIIGLLRAGGVWVTVPCNAGSDEIVSFLRSARAEVLLFGSEFAESMATILAGCDYLRVAVCIDEDHGGFVTLESLCDSGGGAIADFDLRPDEVVTVFGSGGTSGAPKGVMMTGAAWELLIASAALSIGTVGAVRLVISPLMQTAGAGAFLMDLLLGTTFILLKDFYPGQVLEAIQSHHVTHLFLPPTALSLLVTHPAAGRHDYSSLRYLTYGGAPIATEVIREAMNVFGPVLTTGFAQTETGGPVTHFSPEEHAQALAENRIDRLGSCGRETLFARVEIMDESGRTLPPGHEGEIVVRTGHLMKGYCSEHSPDTRELRIVNGWYCSGDIGSKDDDGYVYIVDRKRDMIISCGYNIFPAEIERVLEAQPGVAGAAVVGAPHESLGEVVCAVIELKPGCDIDLESLRRFCQSRLTPTKTPASIEVWPSLPRGNGGKVLRREVRKSFWKDASRRI